MKLDLKLTRQVLSIQGMFFSSDLPHQYTFLRENKRWHTIYDKRFIDQHFSRIPDRNKNWRSSSELENSMTDSCADTAKNVKSPIVNIHCKVSKMSYRTLCFFS